MGFARGLHAVRRYVDHTFDLGHLKRSVRVAMRAAASSDEEWVIVYRTAQGFCCIYHDVPIDFADIEDMHAWAEDKGVQTYFIGL